MSHARRAWPAAARRAALGAAVAGIVAAGLLIFHPGVRGELRGLYDEGNTLCAAWRVAQGDVLYRDLWTMHAPGTAHLLAAAFATFGTAVVVERGLKLVVVGLLCALGYLAFRRFLGPVGAAASVAIGVASGLHPVLLSVDTGLAAMLGSLLAVSVAIEGGFAPRRLFWAGAAIGLTAWFRHDYAVYAALASSAVVAYAGWGALREGHSVRPAARALAALWLGAAAPVALMLAYFLARGALVDMVRQMIVFPLTKFGAVRRIPVPSLDAVAEGLPFGVLFWLTPPTLAAGAVLAGLDLRRGARAAASLLLVCLGGLLLFNYARVRADLGHLWPSLVLAVPVFVALATRAWRAALNQRRVALGAVAALLLAGVGALGVTVVDAALRSSGPVRPARLFDAVPAGLPAAGVLLDPTLEQALRFLDAEARPAARVFVGNDRHDRILFNCSLCYFLLQRPGPTRYYNLHPGLATTARVQREIVEQLQAQEVQWVLLWEARLRAASGRRPGRGVTLLDEYLESQYESAARYGRWEVRRRARAASAAPSGPDYAVALDARPGGPNRSASPDSSVRGRKPKSLVSSP